MEICSFEGCGRKKRAKGLCSSHYNMMTRGEELRPLFSRKIKYKNIGPCKVDNCDTISNSGGYCKTHYNQIWKWGEIREKKSCRTHPEFCSIAECARKYAAKGLCSYHYHRLKVYGSLELIKKPKKEKTIIALKKCQVESCLKPRGSYNKEHKEKCDVKDCDNDVQCKGLCNKHYQRLKRHGDTGINYHRKYRDKGLSVMSRDDRYKINMDEKEYLDTVFKEHVGDNEGENIYY